MKNFHQEYHYLAMELIYFLEELDCFIIKLYYLVTEVIQIDYF